MTVLDSFLPLRPTAGAEVAGAPLLAATIPLGGVPGRPVMSPNGNRLYVPVMTSNTVMVIDTQTNTVIRNPLTFGEIPIGAAVSPGGNRVYVSNFGSGTVSVIDATINAVIATIPIGGSPLSVAVSPNGNLIYVGNFSNLGTVSVINASTNTVVATVTVGGFVNGMALALDGSRLYVTSDDSLSVINASTNTVVATVTVQVGGTVNHMALDPDGSRIYVLFVRPDQGGNALIVIDTTTNTVVGTIEVGRSTSSMAVRPRNGPDDGHVVYVTDFDSGLVVVAADVMAAVQRIKVGTHPTDVAVARNGSQLYVIGNRGAGTDTPGIVSVIDSTTGNVITTTQVGTSPNDLVVTARNVYVPDQRSNTLFIIDI